MLNHKQNYPIYPNYPITCHCSVQEASDTPDATAVPPEPVAFTLEDSSCRDEEIHVIPLHKKNGELNYIFIYSKTCLKQPLKRRPEIGFQDRLLL